LRSIISKPSLHFQQFFDPNQGSAGFKIDNFVTIKSFPLKVRPSTAVATLRRLKKISLPLSVGSLSYSDSSIDWFFCSVSNTYFDHQTSKRWISTTVQAILIIFSCIDGQLKCQFAARRFVFLFVLVVELWFFKVDLGIQHYFFSVLLAI